MSDKPEISREDVALLENILCEHGGWMLAREIAVSWRWQEKFPQGTRSRAAWLTAQERKIRAIANGSGGGILSYPGSAGYKLRITATVEEVNTAVAKLRHQSAEMHARAAAIENYGKPIGQLELV